MRCNQARQLARGVIVIIAALIPAHAPAAGPHFTFTVPLELNNLPPEINEYSVRCTVIAGVGLLARGETRGAISSGRFRGDVVVNVTVPEPARNPSDATAYKCGLHLSGVNDLNVSATVPSNRFSYMDDSFTRFPLAPGAPLRKTTGEIALPR